MSAKTIGCALSLFLVGAFSVPAAAESVATRCDVYGCAKIVCYRDGDRCFRVDRERYGYQPEWHSRYRDEDHDSRWYGAQRYSDRDGWRYHCDYDGDHCEVSRDRYRGDGW
ncbi:MAG: hypothetical protein P4L57_04065 [Rhizomicrobium sp.]|nr:hypothetical protein [Rhizomicrobium sp.]